MHIFRSLHDFLSWPNRDALIGSIENGCLSKQAWGSARLVAYYYKNPDHGLVVHVLKNRYTGETGFLSPKAFEDFMKTIEWRM